MTHVEELCIPFYGTAVRVPDDRHRLGDFIKRNGRAGMVKRVEVRDNHRFVVFDDLSELRQ